MRSIISDGQHARWPHPVARFALCTFIALVPVTGSAFASTMIYTPTNPDFGGNPLNSTQLLGVANAINKFQAPVTATSGSGGSASSTQAQQFLAQLEDRFLSALASNVTDAIFGPNPQDHGQIVFGDQTITFDRGLSAVDISILDSSTGETTHITIPLLTGSP